MTLESISLKYENQKLFLIDQTLLPFDESWLEVESPENMFQIIKTLKVRGAPLIGVAAALSLAIYSKTEKNAELFKSKAMYLGESRPTAVNLMVAIDRLISIADKGYSHEAIEDEAIKIFNEDVQLCEKISSNGAALIKEGETILTHCNTGGLATAGMGTALGVIHQAHSQKKNIHVYVDETRPLLQGGRLTTWELDKLGVPYNLICDNMAGFVMKTKKVDKVIVGADRIALNGDFANKIGTYSLAVLCKHHNVDFYVAAPYTTIDFKCPTGDEIPIEQRQAFELRGVRGHYGQVQWAKKEGVSAYNPAFDVTPAELVTGWILDNGVYNQETIKNIKDIQC